MQKHWREIHQWSQHTRRGRVGPREKAQGEAELARSFAEVSWQQVFPSGKGSYYIHIQYPNGRQSPPPPAGHTEQVVDYMIATWEQAQAARGQEAVIEADQATDVNPWLRTTGWARYLQEVHQQDLPQLVEAPTEDPQSATEQAVRVIWDTMEQVARRSQQTVQRCGAGICMEAVCTEPGQTLYHPLLVYMNETSIQKYVQPWQQILTFIARTQAEQAQQGSREWQGLLLVYSMTRRQRQKWQTLWQLTMPVPSPPRGWQTRIRVVTRFPGAGRMLEETASPGSSSKSSTESSTGEEEEEGYPAAVEAWRMSPIKQACLEFCIKLLNQHHQTHEYESALVCAMAVQGWGEASWRDLENYISLISHVVKLARFMVVQKALWLDPHAMHIIYMWHLQEQKQARSTAAAISWPLASTDDQLGDINGDPTNARISVERKESFHDRVKQIVSSFMIRGTHGPLQTLLDWRIYGLK
ncbi:hypothetical protein BDW59DRAFT_166298 [Aspergillus cavernicola]|uniref:Fungal-specific transcription factor domain-containing protein n=1 Tax=Aspergillus cavernicola TaxID=176166 RepID=A0ABR4HM73_9EURO